MIDDQLNDGQRIAELLASEVEGHQNELDVTGVTEDVEPTPDGSRVYDIVHDGEVLAEVYLHETRVHLEFERGLEDVRQAAENAELRTRSIASRPPRL
ncbi:MAG: hypothetical protein ABEI52_00765, partial [Halobacteriaceae archaeon]